MIEQIVFPIKAEESYKQEDFIISACNKLAYETVNNWPNNNWGVKPYNRALLITGPESSGKSFLTKIWAEKVGIVWPENLILDTPKHMVMEDIDQIREEENLLHIFNLCSENGKYLLMTAKNLPQFKLPDLASRINSINKITINQPDDDLIKLLVFKLFSNCSIIVGQEVINYLLPLLPRDFAAIKKVITNINEQALIHGRKVTVPFVKACL